MDDLGPGSRKRLEKPRCACGSTIQKNPKNPSQLDTGGECRVPGYRSVRREGVHPEMVHHLGLDDDHNLVQLMGTRTEPLVSGDGSATLRSQQLPSNIGTGPWLQTLRIGECDQIPKWLLFDLAHRTNTCKQRLLQ